MDGIVRSFFWSYFVQGKASYLAFVNPLRWEYSVTGDCMG